MEPRREIPQNPERPNEPPRIKWTLWTLGPCCVLISFLLGIALDVANRPNIITFYLDTNTKLTLKPQPGDIINWISYDPNVDPRYSFFVGPNGPCRNGTTHSVCIYDPTLTPVNLDTYSCAAGITKCSDPGVGPKSVPGQGNENFLIKFLKILKFDFARLFGLTLHLSDDDALVLAGRAKIAPPASAAVTPATATAPQIASTFASGPVLANVVCNNSKPDVEDNDRVSLPTIPQVPGQFITWYPAVGYTITSVSKPTLDDICIYPSGNGISSSGNQTCQVKPDAAPGTTVYYKVMTNDSIKGISPCGNSGDTDFSVKVVAPPK